MYKPSRYVLLFLALCATGCDEVRTLGGPAAIRVKIPDELRDRGFMGVEFDPTEDVSGALICSVVTDSCADKAGIQQADIIYQVDGNAMGSVDDVLTLAKSWKPNQVISVGLIRDAQRLRTEVALMPIDEIVQLKAVTDMRQKGDSPRPFE